MNTVIDVVALNSLDRNEEFSFKAFKYVDLDSIDYYGISEDDERYYDFVYYAGTREELYETLMAMLNNKRTEWCTIPGSVEEIVVTTSIKSIPEEDRLKGRFASFTLFWHGANQYKYDFKERIWKKW